MSGTNSTQTDFQTLQWQVGNLSVGTLPGAADINTGWTLQSGTWGPASLDFSENKVPRSGIP